MVVVAMVLILKAWITPSVIVDFNATDKINFTIAAAVMGLLAAGGNVINDYFDIAEDAINKPRRALVGRVISRRKTMAFHYVLSGLASMGSVWLSWRVGSLLPLLWCAIIGILLYGYSPWFKRRFLRGNLIIALTVGQLPFWALLSIIPCGHWGQFLSTTPGMGLATYAILSAYLTFVREITKDVQDETGDRAAAYDTLAVRWGKERTTKLLHQLHIGGWALLLAAAWAALCVLPVQWEVGLFLFPFLGTHIQLSRGIIESVSAWQKLTLAGGLIFLAALIW